MATWDEISRECFLASRELIESGHYRSSINRAYYGLYASITSELRQRGFKIFNQDRPNPGHSQIMQMLEHNILNLRKPDVRRRCVRSAKNVRRSREIADYVPEYSIDRSFALSALRDASLVSRTLGKE